jgi:threonyl-tRNA synthetase
MFTTESEKRDYALKPMNCPGHILIYKQGIKSYRDLPLRYGEFGNCHRNEPSGGLHGIMRVRGFTQDDGHIFCTEEQILPECLAYTALLQKVYKDFGFTDIIYKVATRPAARIGSDEIWDKAEGHLIQALDKKGLSYDINPGDGSFYGPKIDLHMTDSLGRSWQIGTVQLDYNMPMRFGLTYTGADNAEHQPAMLHRALMGSYERFIAILIEHYGGELPVWLTPVQAIVLPIADRHLDYAGTVRDELYSGGVRAELDERSESVGRKIRDAELRKIPYMLVVGDREQEARQVAVREHRRGDEGSAPVSEFIARVHEQVKSRSNP